MRQVVAASLLVAFAAAPVFADEVELVTGEKLKGTVVRRDDAGVVLDHPVLGRLTIPAAQVKPPAPPPSPWKFKIEAGGSGSKGNVDQSALHAAVEAILDDDARRLRLAGGWSRAEVEDERTADKAHVEGTHDWKIQDSPWSVFATSRMDWDEFQDWSRRFSIGAGVGYAVVDRDDLKLRLRAGLAETRQWGSADEDDDDWRLEGIVGAEATWKVNSTNTIDAKVTYHPDFSNGGEYRILSSLSWAVKIAEDSGLSLKLGVEDEYDTHVSEPFEKHDRRWFAALLWEF